MNHPFRLYAAVAAISLASLSSTPALPAKTDLDNVCVSVGRLLEEGHYTHQPLNDDVSKKFLADYLELLDFSHLFFTQKDVDALTAKYGTSLDDDVLLGNLKPAYEIYDLYQKRVDERVAKVKELLKQPMDFKTDETIEVSRQKAPWPKDEAEADELWRGRIASELLQEHLSEHPIEPGPQLVARRYDRLARNVHEEDRDEQVKIFLDALRSNLRSALGIFEQGRSEEFQHQHGSLARRYRSDAADRRWLRQNREPGSGRPGARRMAV